MQQTEKYQFNLIEGGDDFSPTPLNQNMEKVEAQLGAVAEHFTQVAANLGSGGKTCRIAWGAYAGNGKYGQANPNSLAVDFTPVLVLIRAAGPVYTAVYVRGAQTGGCTWNSGNTVNVTWSGKSVSWFNDSGDTYQNNAAGYTYHYVVLGYSE